LPQVRSRRSNGAYESDSYLFDGWQRVVDAGGSLSTIAGASHANFSDIQFVAMPDDSAWRRVLGSVQPEEMWRQTSER
jgi:hypothetical protein